MTALFSLSAAFARTPVGEFEIVRPVDFGAFVAEFRQFDWPGEITREFWANKSSPAIGVTNLGDNSTLWVGAYDWLRLLHPNGGPTPSPAISFYVGLNNAPPPPDIYCRKEDRNIVDCKFGADSPEVVERLFCLYFLEQYRRLYQELFELQIYD